MAACTTGDETANALGVVLADPEHVQAVLLGEDAVANDVAMVAVCVGVDVGVRRKYGAV